MFCRVAGLPANVPGLTDELIGETLTVGRGTLILMVGLGMLTVACAAEAESAITDVAARAAESFARRDMIFLHMIGTVHSVR